MHNLRTYLASTLVSAGLLLGPAMPVAAQRGDRNANYYDGMHDSVQKGDYARYSRDDERRHHHDNGGIGPGTGAAIGAAGGAVLGAVFGGGLKGTLVGGAAGAGIGAIVGEATKDNHHNRHR